MVVLGRGIFLLSEVPLQVAQTALLAPVRVQVSSFSSLLSSLELSDANVDEPYMRALRGTAAHFCEVVLFTFPYHPTALLTVAPYGMVRVEG